MKQIIKSDTHEFFKPAKAAWNTCRNVKFVGVFNTISLFREAQASETMIKSLENAKIKGDKNWIRICERSKDIQNDRTQLLITMVAKKTLPKHFPEEHMPHVCKAIADATAKALEGMQTGVFRRMFGIPVVFGWFWVPYNNKDDIKYMLRIANEVAPAIKDRLPAV